MDKEYFICKRCGYTLLKEFSGGRPENWAEEYCQDCGSAMSVAADKSFIKEVIKLYMGR